MTSGLDFIHTNRHVHRDINSNNILISLGGDRLIIADFGLVKKVHDTESYSASNTHGHDQWLAPERILQKYNPHKNHRTTLACDVFSLGCVFYFFLTKGSHPFGNEWLIGKNIVEGKFNLESESSFEKKIYI